MRMRTDRRRQFAVFMTATLTLGCGKAPPETASPPAVPVSTISPWEGIKDRVVALGSVDRKPDSEVDAQILGMIELAVKGSTDDGERLRQFTRLTQSDSFAGSQYLDDLIYDLMVQSYESSPAPASWAAVASHPSYGWGQALRERCPESSHNLAGWLITLSLTTGLDQSDVRSLREAGLEWIKQRPGESAAHGPYFDDTRRVPKKDFRASPPALTTMNRYRQVLEPEAGFAKADTYVALMTPFVQDRSEVWIREAISVLRNNKAQIELARLLSTLGEMRFDRGAYAEALEYFEEAVRANPGDKPIAMLRDKARFEVMMLPGARGEPPKARVEAPAQVQRQTAEAEPRNVWTGDRGAKALNAEGMQNYKQHNYDKAAAAFAKAVAVDPNYGTAYFNLACTHALNKDVYNALKSLKRALDLNAEYYVPKAERDADFANIRDSAEFRALLDGYRK